MVHSTVPVRGAGTLLPLERVWYRLAAAGDGWRHSALRTELENRVVSLAACSPVGTLDGRRNLSWDVGRLEMGWCYEQSADLSRDELSKSRLTFVECTYRLRPARPYQSTALRLVHESPGQLDETDWHGPEGHFELPCPVP